MELKEAIRKRRSVRKFLRKKPSRDTIREILEYANLAPSAGNLQARDFIVVDDEVLKQRLAEAALNQGFLSEAPYDIVVCANLDRIAPYGSRGKELYCLQDCAAAIEHILLLALEYGLAACWVGAFDEDEVVKLLELPRHVKPVAIIAIGYPAEEPEPTPRIKIDKLMHFNRW